MPAADPNRNYQAMSAAIAVLTGWLESGADNAELVKSVLLSYVEEDDLSDPELILGFLQVAGVLLIKLEKHGDDPMAVLQDLAARYRPT